MTSKERMLTAMRNQKPDRVPVAPDISNMIPCRLTGKPFWDIYLSRKPALWEAYLEAVNYFGFDGWLPIYSSRLDFADEQDFIIQQTPERIVTRRRELVNGKAFWSPFVMVYPYANPPSYVLAEKLGFPEIPDSAAPIAEPPPYEEDIPIFRRARDHMGDAGVVGLSVWIPMLGDPDSLYRYYDEYELVREEIRGQEAKIEAETARILAERPDFVFMGYSGGLTYQTPEIFRDIALPSVQKVTAMAKAAGIPSQMHSCGRQRALVEIVATETQMSSINPLERPPMGDCDLAEVKRSFGDKISMLFGTQELVREEARAAIDAAGANGGFILSTGDQCGRDTPDENIFALIETAHSYGQY